MSIILSKIDLKKRFGFGFGFGRNSDKSRNSVSVSVSAAKLSFGRTLIQIFLSKHVYKKTKGERTKVKDFQIG